MSDLDERFLALDRVGPPDLWPDVQHREPRPMREPPPGRRFLAAAVAFAVASAGIALGVRAFRGGESAPTAAVGNGRIAFVVSRDGEYEIFLMDENGASLVRLSGGRDPAWSPDGTRVAFTANEDRLGISIVNADGTGSVKLTDKPAYAQTPTWSPDGEQIAFAAADGIYVMDSDGTDVHRITGYTGPLACADFHPSWSPDGARIAFAVRCDGGGLGIFTVDADGSDRAMVTGIEGESTESLVFDGGPAWSPDGARIAFTGANKPDVNTQHVYTINADGSGIDRITDGDVSDWSPIWSPDGAEIAFISMRAEGRGIYVMDPYGLNVRRLTSDPTAVGTIDSCCLSWQPVPAVEGSPSASDAVSAEVTGRVRLDGVPGPVAAADGAVWVTTYDYEHEGAAVARIDATTNEIVATVPIEGLPPSNLAVGAGALWVPAGMEHGGPVLMRVDTDTNEVTGRVEGVTGPVVADATGVWAIQDGPDAHDAAVVRLDPETLTIEARIPVGNVPFDMVAGAGSIWVVAWDAQARYQEPSDLLRIDALSGELVATISINGDGTWIAADDAGVWISAWSTIDPNDWNAVFREVCAD